MAPLPPDPYKILGVPKTAQVPDIRTAYRKLVLTCHPDKVQDPAQKEKKLEEFQKLQHAYELLSDENERTKYDEQVKFMELRKEMSKNMPNTSIPRTPKMYVNVNIRADTRSPYAQSPPQAGARVYAQQPRSPKDPGYVYVEDKGMGRSARRSPSREKTSSRKEKEREEERERARRRREEREEHDREQRRLSEKEARKAEKKRREKERGSLHDEKRRHRSPPITYVEEYSDEVEVRTEKKKASSRKHRERERDRESTPKAEVIAGIAEVQAKARAAEDYINRGTRNDHTSSLRNSPPSVPTPPPPRDAPYPAPPAPRVANELDDDDDEEEMPHRSRAASRRDSFDPPRSKDRLPFLHRKSASSFHDEPSLSSSPGRLASMATESPPRRGSFGRSSTFSVPKPVIPTLHRAHTFAADGTDSRDPRGRSRSKHHPQQIDEEDIDEEEDEEEHRRIEEERRRRKHRSSRREPVTAPMTIPYSKSSYSGDGRVLGRESSSYRSSPDRYDRPYHPSSGSSGHRVVSTAYHEPVSSYMPPRVKQMKRVELEDLAYSRSYNSHEGYVQV